jgi:hypothetical protein
MKVFPLNEELKLYISSTDACLIKLRRNMDESNVIDVERLEAYIRFQQQAGIRLQSAIDDLLGRSQDG